MKEIILSFDNKQIELNREFLFDYQNDSINKAYWFIYQRDGIGIKIEYLKNLVTFSKRTGFSLFYLEQFLSHREKFKIKDDSAFVHIHNSRPIRFLPVTNLLWLYQQKTINRFKESCFLYHNAKFVNYLYKNDKFGKNLNDIKYVKINNNLSLKQINNEKLHIFSNNLLLKSFFSNLYENIIVSQNDDKNLNNYRNFLLDHQDNILNSFQNLYLNRYKENTVNVINHYFLKQDYYLNNFKYEYFLSKESKAFYHQDTFISKEISGLLNIFYQHPLQRSFNVNMNLFESIYMKDIHKNFILFETNNAKKFLGNNIILYTYNLIESTNNFSLNLFNYIFTKQQGKILNTFSQYLINTLGKTAYYQELNSILFNRNIANYFNVLNQASTDNTSYLDVLSNNENVIKDKSYAYILNDTLINKNNNKYTMYQDDIFVYKRKYYFYYNQENDFTIKYKENLSRFNNPSSIKDSRKPFYRYDGLRELKKIKRSFVIYDKLLYISRKSKNFLIYNNLLTMLKNNKSFEVYKNHFLNISKYNHFLSINQQYPGLNKKYQKIKSFLPGVSLNNSHKNVYINNNILKTDKKYQYVYEDLTYIYMQKFAHNLFDTLNHYHVIKEYTNADILNDYSVDITKLLYNVNLYTNDKGTILFVNKINRPLFTYQTINDIYKKRKQAGTAANLETSSKIKNRMLFDSDLFCDKLIRNAKYIAFINESIIKKQIQTWFINDDVFIDKTLEKYIIYDNINVYRKNKQAFFNKDVFISRNNNKASLFDQDWINYMRYAFFNQDILITIKNRNLQREKEEEFFNEIKHSEIANSLLPIDIEKYIHLNQMEEIARTNNFPTQFYDEYFLSRDMLLDTLPEFSELNRIIREMNLISNDSVMDWTWTYEEDEGFDDPFKIDELLLPENDSRYEDFEDILFNRNTLKPRSPIKIIDDYTFIAKYPNHYPIKDDNGENAYKNIAVEYLDVRTSIMRQVFLGYYKIWQDHIFEFSRMTIPQSAKKILDYLYVWILMQFPEEDIPEALRTFRLVRWYLERGIIECSEYYITYEPNDLTSGKLDTTNLEIPSDLTEGNDTMYIDTVNHVIRNNPDQIPTNTDAEITFYIDNKKETTISFSLHTLFPVTIILNRGTDKERILDRIELPVNSKMLYNIPYNEEGNTFTIIRYANDNNDKELFIGNIVIAGMGNTGELNIDFNPKIQGNKVLNYVSQKVISYVNLYNDNETLINGLIKGNVHLSEVYDKLLEYWELHWQNKDKGKRLTIKRT